MENKNLEEHFRNRKDIWQDLLTIQNKSDKFNEQLENLWSDILSVDIDKTYNILLSWGGPSDGFKVDTDCNNELKNIHYWYADWGTYNERTLNDNERDEFLTIYGAVLESYEIKY